MKNLPNEWPTMWDLEVSDLGTYVEVKGSGGAIYTGVLYDLEEGVSHSIYHNYEEMVITHTREAFIGHQREYEHKSEVVPRKTT